MLDVALDKLVGGREQEVLADQPGLGMDEGEHVLELVAEAEGPTRLVEPRAAPEARRYHLVEEPAVHQQVHGPVRRLDRDGREGPVPVPPDRCERVASRGHAAMPLDQGLRLVRVSAEAEGEDDDDLLAVGDLERDLERPARVEPGAHPAREADSFQGGRPGHRPVPAEELVPVARCRPVYLVHVEEGRPVGELAVVEISGQDRPGQGVDLGHHMHRHRRPVLAEDPLDVPGHRDRSRPARAVPYPDLPVLHGGLDRDVDGHRGDEPVLLVLEDGVPEPVTDQVGSGASCREGREGPERTGLIVSQVEGLTRPVSDRVVPPGREPELVRVLRPGVSPAALRYDRAEGGVREDVHPRRGRDLAGAVLDDVLAPILGEAADPVVVVKGLAVELRRGREGRARACYGEPRDLRVRPPHPFDLLGERAVAVGQDDARQGLHQHPVLLGDLVESPDEDPARPVDQVGIRAEAGLTDQLVGEVLPIPRHVLVPEEQVRDQPLAPPVGMGLDHLPDEANPGLL